MLEIRATLMLATFVVAITIFLLMVFDLVRDYVREIGNDKLHNGENPFKQ